MRVLGLTFVGTRTERRSETAALWRDVLGLEPVHGHGMDAEVFALPDGSRLAVTSPDGPDDVERTVGLLVDDLDGIWERLRAAGIETDDEVSGNETQRYVHFRGPDGRLYELVEERG